MPSDKNPNSGTCEGPTRESGGTTGAGNPAAASRTGGATGGVDGGVTRAVTGGATGSANAGEDAARGAQEHPQGELSDPMNDPAAPKAPGGTPDPNFSAPYQGPIKDAKHPEEVPRPAKQHQGGTAGPRRTSDQR